MGKLKLQKTKKQAAPKREGGQVSVEQLCQTLGFPEGTAFLGYAIYREASDEFLTEYKELPDEGVVMKSWTTTPQLAACSKTLAQAVKRAQTCADAVVVGLFDTGDQIMTVTMSANRSNRDV